MLAYIISGIHNLVIALLSIGMKLVLVGFVVLCTCGVRKFQHFNLARRKFQPEKIILQNSKCAGIVLD